VIADREIPSLAELAGRTHAELEALFAAPGPIAVPEGRFRGAYLLRFDTAETRRASSRLWHQAFRRLPFGVDFASRTWFFGDPRLRTGRFEPRAAPSRWRETEVIALHYHVSRLPAAIRDQLYDEIKPLGESLCLGIGGVNAERGRGEHFWFALER
jgi:hypothetical protein